MSCFVWHSCGATKQFKKTTVYTLTTPLTGKQNVLLHCAGLQGQYLRLLDTLDMILPAVNLHTKLHNHVKSVNLNILSDLGCSPC